MISNELVSVIVPVYKVEDYLRVCVDSLTNQTYRNIEIILVDDKSPDKSGKLCDELALKDQRIKVIHKAKNEGLNMARKTGFDVSTGKYITFLDSDDYFRVDAIEKSLTELLNNNADVVVYGTQEFNDTEKPTITDAKSETKILTTKKQRVNYAFHGGENLPGVQYITVWGKLYTREVIESIDWNVANYRIYEDNFWTPQALLHAKKVVLVSDPLIYYRRNVAYGTDSTNLGNRLTGNSINGNAVGYLEFIELVRVFYSQLLDRYGLGDQLDKETTRKLFLIKTSRLDNLAKAGLLDSENNMKFVVSFLEEYIVAKNQHIDNLNASIGYLEGVVRNTEAKVVYLENVIEGLNGVKASIKHAVKNVKRKITKG